MKKIIALIAVFASALSMFAFSDADKSVMESITKNPFKSSEEIHNIAKQNSAVLKSLIDWGVAKPQEAAAYINAQKERSRFLWLLFAYCDDNSLKSSFTIEQDYAIFGGRNTCDSAYHSKAEFHALKKEHFTNAGLKMDSDRVLFLAIHHDDIVLAETFPVKELVGHFTKYLNAVEISLENVSPEEAWLKYSRLVQKFTPYQSEGQVKENWVRLLSNQDSMAMIIKQSKNLGN